MNAVTAVAPGGATPLQSAVEASPLVGQNGPAMEQKLLDYIMRFQAEGLAKGQHLANPAALSGQALKTLKGYFERATALQDSASRKAGVMSESNDGTLSANNQLVTLPGGPARERLEPAFRASDAPAQQITGVTDAELNRAVDALVEVMRYSMDTAMVTTATNNISKSATTLTRGQ